MTVTPDLDRRFREAAAAEGLLDVGFDVVDSPIGPLLVAATRRGLARIFFDAQPELHLDRLAQAFGPRVLRSASSVDAAHRQLDEYFAGDRSAFELDVDLRGAAPFAQHVLDELARVPYGADDHVRHARGEGRRAPGRARRRHGDEPQPDPDRAPLPPRRRRQRQPDRLRRRSRRQGAAAAAGRGTAVVSRRACSPLPRRWTGGGGRWREWLKPLS